MTALLRARNNYKSELGDGHPEKAIRVAVSYFVSKRYIDYCVHYQQRNA